MGASHSSHTNITNKCTSFDCNATYCKACFGDSLEVCLSTVQRKEDNAREYWNAEYKIGKRLEYSVDCNLQVKRDNNGVVNVDFVLSDFANNITEFCFEITRVDDGFHRRTRFIETAGAYYTKVYPKQGYTLETTIVSYNCSFRDALYILQLKRRNNSENAYMVTMVHYYVTKDAALRVGATICRGRDGDFMLEVNGPYIKKDGDLSRDIDEARRLHRVLHGAKSSTKIGDSNSSVNTSSQIVKNVSSKGLVNSNGYTQGALNNSLFLGCNFPNLRI